MFTLYVQFIVVYSTIVSYVLFILSCTTFEVRIFLQPWYNFIVRILYTIFYYVLVQIYVQPICIILLILHHYSAPLQRRRNWCQPPLPAARRPSGANGGAPVPKPANFSPSIPPPYHPSTIWSVRPIHLVASQFPHTIQRIISQFL